MGLMNGEYVTPCQWYRISYYTGTVADGTYKSHSLVKDYISEQAAVARCKELATKHPGRRYYVTKLVFGACMPSAAELITNNQFI